MVKLEAVSYTHLEKYEDISGYTNPHESKHDFFQIGHTSTSIDVYKRQI